MGTGSDKQGPLRILLVIIAFYLILTAPTSSIYGKDRHSSKAKDWIVVVDPGHGGRDKGAVGPKGAMEKDVALTVAILLKKELEEKDNIKVVLTRLSDRLVSIEERCRIANRAKADCLISLHVNGYFSPHAKGIRSYYLTFLKDGIDEEDDSGSRRPTGKRNASQNAEDEVVRFILKDLERTEWINEGGRLARSLVSELASLPGGSDREVRQILSPVLLGAEMSACLVELGFITNPSEEKRLRDRSYCKRLARALARGVMAFFQAYGSESS